MNIRSYVCPLLLMLALPSFASNDQSLSTQTYEQQTIKDIFGYQDEFNQTPEQQWAKQIVDIINRELGSTSAYHGQRCKVQIQFTETASIRKIRTSNQNPLCDTLFLTIRQHYQFPLPRNAKLLHPVYQSLTLTFVP
ncbi:hypothetical protein LDJ79_15145 [Vibrio tritonius]|uniref:TonB C-terminal domain-containing protein n=1 Tax=Vibrio tritonius TaxID=1435069 RepID=A0ABS7YP51_9VIBR|nr:cell envelope integrity protein TolA [Vibrio tritonius]MCA2017459.1 hypothetical protein [Vibrio tritonius]